MMYDAFLFYAHVVADVDKFSMPSFSQSRLLVFFSRSCFVFIVFVVFLIPRTVLHCTVLHCTDLRVKRIAILVFLVIVESPCEFLYCSVLHCAVLRCPRSQQIVCI
jgi:hypothetical protein